MRMRMTMMGVDGDAGGNGWKGNGGRLLWWLQRQRLQMLRVLLRLMMMMILRVRGSRGQTRMRLD